MAVGLYNCESEGDTTAAETQASIGLAPEQIISQYDSIFVSGVTSPDQGWIVLRRDNNDSPDMSGHILEPFQVEAGFTNDTAFVVNNIDIADEEKLWVTLHEDAGSQGTYEGDANGADAQYQEDGQPVQKSVIIHAPSVEAADQVVASNEVTLTNVQAGTASWMVIHDHAAGGGPGAIVSVTAVSEGTHDELTVTLDDSLVYADGDTLYPMLHIDAGETGTFEFPGDDVPEIFGQAGDVIVTNFQVAGPTSFMAVSDQILSQNMFTFDSTDVDYPHWLVFHSGTGEPIISDTVSVSAGANGGMMVPYQAAPSTTPDLTIVPMIHIDNGVIGTFEFPAKDSLDDRTLDGAIEVGSATNEAPSIAANNQAVNSLDTTITVASAKIGVDGWIAVHADSATGEIIGTEWIAAGENTDVTVKLDSLPAVDDVLYPMLHIDAGESGTFEFPGADVPEIFGWDAQGEPEIMVTSFIVTN
ncbi:MAG: hypothetical protein GF372_08145 [Candidatus Marinimicrobia bacterium]|nr:hypothetical protein [Candidatus Neomarinimicrobiota bacterium]